MARQGRSDLGQGHFDADVRVSTQGLGLFHPHGDAADPGMVQQEIGIAFGEGLDQVHMSGIGQRPRRAMPEFLRLPPDGSNKTGGESGDPKESPASLMPPKPEKSSLSIIVPEDLPYIESMYCNDSGAVRAQIYSNGGLANYSANNVNLSDIRTKPDFVVLDDAELDKLEAAFIAVDWAKYKYHDQTHDDWNYGPSAQGVEKAFAVANPAITDVWNPTKQVKVGEDEDGNAIYEATPTPADEQLKGIYSADLENIGLALLARLLRRVAALEAKGG